MFKFKISCYSRTFYFLQIKSAYQQFAFDTKVQSEDDDCDATVEENDDLGKLATNHVKMCSIKDGSWCWLLKKLKLIFYYDLVLFLFNQVL